MQIWVNLRLCHHLHHPRLNSQSSSLIGINCQLHFELFWSKAWHWSGHVRFHWLLYCWSEHSYVGLLWKVVLDSWRAPNRLATYVASLDALSQQGHWLASERGLCHCGSAVEHVNEQRVLSRSQNLLALRHQLILQQMTSGGGRQFHLNRYRPEKKSDYLVRLLFALRMLYLVEVSADGLDV